MKDITSFIDNQYQKKKGNQGTQSQDCMSLSSAISLRCKPILLSISENFLRFSFFEVRIKSAIDASLNGRR